MQLLCYYFEYLLVQEGYLDSDYLLIRFCYYASQTQYSNRNSNFTTAHRYVNGFKNELFALTLKAWGGQLAHGESKIAMEPNVGLTSNQAVEISFSVFS